MDRSVQYPFRTRGGTSSAQYGSAIGPDDSCNLNTHRPPPGGHPLVADGSVPANGDGGAGFAIFVQGALWVTDASPAGHGVSELRAEAIACLAGLLAVLTTTTLARVSESSRTPCSRRSSTDRHHV